MEFALHGYGGNTDGFSALLWIGWRQLFYGMKIYMATAMAMA